MPPIGLGSAWMDDDAAARSVATGIELGYRLIDTAELYQTERGVGRGVKASGVAREDIFVTTKVKRENHGKHRLRAAFAASVDRLGLDYVDLYLIHWPNPDLDLYVESFVAMLTLFDEGRVRAVGVSNFKASHLERIRKETGTVPDANQIHVTPHAARAELRSYCVNHGIVVQTWGPLGGPGAEVLSDPTVVRIAAGLSRSPAQVVLRWNYQSGLVPVVKSTHQRRQRANRQIHDFALSADHMSMLAALDRGDAGIADSDRVGY